jgi:hypothetical protein
MNNTKQKAVNLFKTVSLFIPPTINKTINNKLFEKKRFTIKD